jgi:hypothetical protein
MPNNTGEFAARVEALRQRLEAAQVRLAGVAKQQTGLLESLARNELEQQKERIGTYQIQARFALASIYDRAAAPPSAAPATSTPLESQGELETVPPAPMDGAPPPPAEEALPPPEVTPPNDTPPATDAIEPGVNTSANPPEAPK